jgi:hypothetical protein
VANARNRAVCSFRAMSESVSRDREMLGSPEIATRRAPTLLASSEANMSDSRPASWRRATESAPAGLGSRSAVSSALIAARYAVYASRGSTTRSATRSRTSTSAESEPAADCMTAAVIGSLFSRAASSMLVCARARNALRSSVAVVR